MKNNRVILVISADADCPHCAGGGMQRAPQQSYLVDIAFCKCVKLVNPLEPEKPADGVGELC